MAIRREHRGVLHGPEAQFIDFLVSRIPQRVTPDQLTGLAFTGALVAGASVIACRYSLWFLASFYLGMLTNWFGDSLDGALARFKRCERHRAGFLIDRCVDTLSFVVLILALGLSPYLTPAAALMLLVAYLMHAIYGLMRTVVDGVQLVGFGGIGATEGRLFIGFWVLVFCVGHIDLDAYQYAGANVFDIVCGFLLVGMLALFAKRVAAAVSRIAEVDDVETSRRSPNFGSNVVSIVRDREGKGRGVGQHDAIYGNGGGSGSATTTIY
jgi:archaetidylinositol phosphate synthase